MSFSRYPEYKESGNPRLGEVPCHWQAMPFKWVIESNDGGVWGNDPTGENDAIVLRSTEQTVDGHWCIKDPALRSLTTLEMYSSRLKLGDLLVTKSSGSSKHIGKTTLVDSEVAELQCCFGNFMQRIRTTDSLKPRLAWYFMNNDVARQQLDFLSSSTTGLANLNGTLIGEILLSVPPKDEQAAICKFLDHETAKIDALIGEQQRLIELLKEKRQAVNSHAVTKGLDSDAPMKDSGVEWLGEVPAHWSVSALRHFAEIRGGIAIGKRYPSTEQLVEAAYLRVANVQDGYVDLTELKRVQVSKTEVDRYSLQRGDVLMNEGGDNLLPEHLSASLFLLVLEAEHEPSIHFLEQRDVLSRTGSAGL
ncbi:restriction endonuclease subunit S domain-containing protein [Wenzhouxiangella indolica]